jgi:hypothetical protein
MTTMTMMTTTAKKRHERDGLSEPSLYRRAAMS